MTDPTRATDPGRNKPDPSTTWAPWWLYLVVILGANYLRGAFLPGSSLPLPVMAVIAFGQAALLFIIVTAVWRATQRGRT